MTILKPEGSGGKPKGVELLQPRGDLVPTGNVLVHQLQVVDSKDLKSATQTSNRTASILLARNDRITPDLPQHMSLAAGTRIGVYEIVSKLGAGGMGEVYRARDPRLGSDVTIKILPSTFIADRDRLARFEREARTLAAVNHANIATIYGIEDSGDRASAPA